MGTTPKSSSKKNFTPKAASTKTKTSPKAKLFNSGKKRLRSGKKSNKKSVQVATKANSINFKTPLKDSSPTNSIVDLVTPSPKVAKKIKRTPHPKVRTQSLTSDEDDVVDITTPNSAKINSTKYVNNYGIILFLLKIANCS